jgi:cytochrome subunit of sulfide dehydrogenase
MKSKTPVQLATLLAVGLLAMPLAGHAEISRGAVLASTCFTCHGTDGQSPGAMPSIYGVPAEIMVKAMQDFRAGHRAATVMDRHAKGYTDEEIVEIADYLAAIRK